MSGLFTVAGYSAGHDPRSVAARMGERMRHLEHQRVEVFSPDCLVGAGRIASGFLNAERQPIAARDGNVLLWLTGEFYHQDARRRELINDGALTADANDAQYALAIFQREGIEGLTSLDGACATLIWPAQTRELVFVTDRIGMYPHFVAHFNGTFALAPELKGILAVPGFPKRVDQVAIAQFARFQQLLGARTWFEDVVYLPPASIVRYCLDDDRMSIERYWDWDRIGQIPSITHDEAADELMRLFDRAVEARLTPAERAGVYLSGGMDSRSIVAYAQPRQTLTTITFGQPNCRDVVLAQEVAARAGTAHHWFPFNDGQWVLEHLPMHLALTEGMASFIHMHGMSTLERARELIDVNLSGWDGGLIVGGTVSWYHRDPWFRDAPSESDFIERAREGFCQEFSWPGLRDQEADALFGPQAAPVMRDAAFESLTDELRRTERFSPDRRIDYIFVEQHARRADANQIIFGRSAFEVRCPYVDESVLDFLYSLPPHIRQSWKLHQSLLTRRNWKLALIPYDRYDAVPHEHPFVGVPLTKWRRGRRKLRGAIDQRYQPPATLYADYQHYLRTDLRPWAESILFDRRTIERGLFDTGTVRMLWQRLLSSGETETVGTIAPLINVELVLRAFVEGDGSDASIADAVGEVARPHRAGGNMVAQMANAQVERRAVGVDA